MPVSCVQKAVRRGRRTGRTYEWNSASISSVCAFSTQVGSCNNGWWVSLHWKAVMKNGLPL